MRLLRFRTLCLSLACALLGACGHTPVTRTFLEAIGSGRSVDQINLNPNLRYLRVSVRSRTVLMVLGYVDPAPEGSSEA